MWREKKQKELRNGREFRDGLEAIIIIEDVSPSTLFISLKIKITLTQKIELIKSYYRIKYCGFLTRDKELLCSSFENIFNLFREHLESLKKVNFLQI